MNVQLEELIRLASRALASLNFSDDEIFNTVRSLLYGQLRGGKNYHGFDRFKWIASHVPSHMRPGVELTFEREEDNHTFIFDGHGGVGYSQMYDLVFLSTELMKSRRRLRLVLKNSYPTNCLGEYVLALGKMGFNSMANTISPKKVALRGGRHPKLSTSGQAYGYCTQPPFVLDFSIGAITNGDLNFAKLNHEELPPESCLDSQGQKTTNPSDVLDDDKKLIGSILPRGGQNTQSIFAGLGINMSLKAAQYGITSQKRGSIIDLEKPNEEQVDALNALRMTLLEGEDSDLTLPGERGLKKAQLVLESGVLDIEEKAWMNLNSMAEQCREERDLFNDKKFHAELLDQLASGDYRPWDESHSSNLLTLVNQFI